MINNGLTYNLVGGVRFLPSTCHSEPTSPSAKQMKFPRWLNAIDLLRKLPKTSGLCVILSKGVARVELLRVEGSA